MKYRLSLTEKAERVERRKAERAAAEAKRQNIRDWFDARREAADKRRKEARRAPRPPRGVDRVPPRLADLSVTVEPYIETPDGNKIDTTLGTFAGVEGNYRRRRARGQRGRSRRLRRRELREVGAANREPDSPLAQQRAAFRAARDAKRGRS